MKKLYGYIIRSYIGPFVATFFIALFILLMQFLWKYIDDLVGKGFDWDIIARLLFYASSTFVPLALPLAVLLSSLMTFGNLGERYELVALKAAGISIKSVMKPMVVFIGALSIVAFLFSNNIMPVANLKMRTLLHDVRKQKPAVSIQPGIFYDEIDNYTIKVNEKANDGKTIKDVVIYDHSKQQGNVSVTVADSGTMQVTKDKRFLIFQLYNGKNYMERISDRKDKWSRPLQVTKFQEELRRIDLSSFSFEETNDEFYKNHYEMMNISQLERSKDSLRNKMDNRRQVFATDIYDRFRYYQSIQPQSDFNWAKDNPFTKNVYKGLFSKEEMTLGYDTSEITYSVISNIFLSAENNKNRSWEDNLKKTGPSIAEHNKQRRQPKAVTQKKQQSTKRQEPKQQSKEIKRDPSVARNPANLRPNTIGYDIRELRKIAREKNLDLDSLRENDPRFPTLITRDTKLNPELLSNFKREEQIKIAEYALNNVRNIINTIDYTDNVLDRKQELIARHDIEWHRKFTLSFACIVLFFVGAPLGAIIRKGGFGFPVVVSVLLFVVYHVISITGEKFARETVIEPWWGMWVSSLVLLPLGVFLTLKATTDAPFLNSDTYVRFFKRLRQNFFKRG